MADYLQCGTCGHQQPGEPGRGRVCEGCGRWLTSPPPEPAWEDPFAAPDPAKAPNDPPPRGKPAPVPVPADDPYEGLFDASDFAAVQAPAGPAVPNAGQDGAGPATERSLESLFDAPAEALQVHTPAAEPEPVVTGVPARLNLWPWVAGFAGMLVLLLLGLIVYLHRQVQDLEAKASAGPALAVGRGSAPQDGVPPDSDPAPNPGPGPFPPDTTASSQPGPGSPGPSGPPPEVPMPDKKDVPPKPIPSKPPAGGSNGPEAIKPGPGKPEAGGEMPGEPASPGGSPRKTVTVFDFSFKNWPLTEQWTIGFYGRYYGRAASQKRDPRREPTGLSRQSGPPHRDPPRRLRGAQ